VSVPARTAAYMIAARRTPVTPRGGGLSAYQVDELAAPVLRMVLMDVGVPPASVDHVILGNALYAGGNPARMAMLRAGLPSTVPAMTLDSQCCSGLDAIIMASRLIEAGAAECVLAGGAESFSRAPIRMKRPLDKTSSPVAYNRPSFAPPPYADPDLAEAAARLATDRAISREAQAEFAIASHAKAIEAKSRHDGNLVLVSDHAPVDEFTRNLTLKTAMRAAVLAGHHDSGLTAATIACEADAAAGVLLVSERIWKDMAIPALRLLAGRSEGGDPSDPALVPAKVAISLFEGLKRSTRDFGCIELMEAYAVQAMVTAMDLGVAPRQLNRLGGALARGHPIGASGAVLAVQLFEQMIRTQGKAGAGAAGPGLALIAAAGGLASGLVVERAVSKGG